MVDCKKLSYEDCLKSSNCIYTKGEKRKYCRKAKNTRKTKSKSKSKSSRTITQKKKNKSKSSVKISYSKKVWNTSLTPNTNNNYHNNLLKMSKQYNDISIKQGDFFIDPCIMLRKLKTYSNNDIYTFTKNNLRNLENMMPVFEPISGKSNHYLFGKDKLILKKQVNSGAYGDIYNAQINGKNVVLKIPKIELFEFRDFFLETFIQNELFCDLRGSFGQGARIPKIEFFGKMKIKNKIVGIIAIEQLDMDGNGFMELMKNDKESNKNCIDMVIQVSQLLTKLQKEYKFMHKDLHSGNIMCNKVGNQYRWYIIDFGMTSIKIDGEWIDGKLDFPYNGAHSENKTHDLRMLFCSIFYNMLSTLREYNGYQKCPIIFLRMLVKYMRPISTYLKTPSKTLFWNTYGDAIQYEDKNLDPIEVNNVFSLAKVNMNNIMDYIYSDMPTLLVNYTSQVNKSNLIRYLSEIGQYLA